MPFLVMILAVTASVAPGQKVPPALRALPPEHTLVGRLLLPSGSGSRGVEVIVKTAARGSEPRKVWLLFDEQGNFSHTFEGNLTRLVVTAGIGREVYRIDADVVSEADEADRIDVGVIDLREQLVKHRLLLRAARGLGSRHPLAQRVPAPLRSLRLGGFSVQAGDGLTRWKDES